ncbi:MAG: hypothetical protein LBU47_03715 [Christensenellaceae bacterium]|jgi:hypothetical protein|nr:hypothetical protein [Christensenellaceae bacterium]
MTKSQKRLVAICCAAAMLLLLVLPFLLPLLERRSQVPQTISTGRIEAAEVSIFYGVSSYAFASQDAALAQSLADAFSGLTLARQEADFDFMTAMMVSFSGPKGSQGFWVDQNGVFLVSLRDDLSQTYLVSGGEFDYGAIYAVYAAGSSANAG